MKVMVAQRPAAGGVSGVAGERRALWFLLTPLLLWLFFYLVMPMVMITGYSLTSDGGMTLGAGGWSLAQFLRTLTVPIYRAVLLRSLWTGLKVTIVTLALGYLPAYFISRARPAVRNLLILLLVVPFWTPYIIRIFAWMLILSTNGLLNKTLMGLGLLSAPLDLLYSPWAVLVGLVYSGLPFMILPIYATMSGIDPRLYEAAMNLGATERQAFREVTVPLSLPGVWAGSLMTFIMAAGSYLAPAILGGPEEIMIAQVVATRFMEILDFPLGAALALLYLVVTLLIVAGANHIVTRQGVFRANQGR